MGLILKEKNNNDGLVLFKDMNVGDIGIIIVDNDRCYNGKCVIRASQIVIDLDNGVSWSKLDKNIIKVKILPKCTEFIIN